LFRSPTDAQKSTRSPPISVDVRRCPAGYPAILPKNPSEVHRNLIGRLMWPRYKPFCCSTGSVCSRKIK